MRPRFTRPDDAALIDLLTRALFTADIWGELMAQAVDLAYAARLPPKEAVAYFRAKGHNITRNWYEQLTEAHARAFTVAKAVRLDVLNTIRDEVDRAVHDGITRREFTRTLAPRLQKLGWWGKQIVVDTQGNAKEIELGSPRRLATIYNVNMRTAYNSGRYAQMMNNAEAYPFWQYVAVMDGRTRPAHAALNGMVFRYDDPFWQTHYPRTAGAVAAASGRCLLNV